jgi:hypothetical protein
MIGVVIEPTSPTADKTLFVRERVDGPAKRTNLEGFRDEFELAVTTYNERFKAIHCLSYL